MSLHFKLLLMKQELSMNTPIKPLAVLNKVTLDLQVSINQVCLRRLVGLGWQRAKRWITPKRTAYLSSPVLDVV